ncbi:MAG: GH3 auxin-responsive promoter family protein [Alphaproteobacteria bacterium]|nr:GH3 auxin-responsive promoter family protein [Alphaproteobacteria bacterium]
MLPTLTTAAWLAASLPAARAFRRALADPARTQQAVLREILTANAKSAFGRAHDFARLRSVDDFRAAVPLGDHETHAPWIERVANGEPAVLTADTAVDRITRFEPSSGSAAARKLIPGNRRLRQQFQRGIAPWVVDLYRHHPRLMNGRAYWSISPALDTERTPGGLPVGFDEDSAYLGGLGQALVDRAMAVPGSVARLRDPRAWRYATLLHLLRARDLRLISVWNPSFLTLLLDALPGWWDALLSDVFAGTEGAPAMPRRAEDLAERGCDDLPRLWPGLGLISCWTDAHAASALPALRAALPGVPLQPKGLLATEAIVTLPWGGAHPLALRSHFFEFEDDDGQLHLAHELAEGQVVKVVVTTGGGLYRYRLHDRVEVTGRCAATPSLRFLGKEDRVSDRRGEKLSEAFVAGVLAALGLTGGFAMLAPEESEPPRYVLYTDQPTGPDLAARLEQRLRENPHYRWCAAVGQLAPAQVFGVRGDGFRAYMEACQGRGQRIGDIKPCALSPQAGWSAALRGAMVTPEPG